MKKNSQTKPINKRVKQQPTRSKQTVIQTLARLPIAEKLMGYAIILLLSFGLYANTIPLGYTFDDKVVITKNTNTQKGFAGIKGILLQDAFTEYFGKTQNLVSGGRYRPLSPITFAIEWEFFAAKNAKGEVEGNPHISHIINILLYAFTGMLVFNIFFSLLSKYTSRKWYLSISFISALLFVAHPLHTEVVANIKGRDEILVMLGSLLSLQLTLRYLETRKILYTIAAAVVFFLALFSKENTITFLAVIPLTVYFFTQYSLKHNLLSVVSLLVATVAFLVIRTKVLGSLFSPPSPELMNNPFLHVNSTADMYATIMYTWGYYLKLLFYPHPLTYDYYPYHIELISWANYKAIVPFLIYGALLFVMIKGTARKTFTSYSLWFFFATFSIVSNLLFPVGAFMNERFIFVSSLAFSLLMAYGLYLLFEKYSTNRAWLKYVSVAIFTITMGLYAAKTIARNVVWESDYTLFTTDVKTSSGSAFGNQTAGKQYYFKAKELKDSVEREKYFKLAIEHLTKAVTIHTSYANSLYFLGEAHYDYNQNYQKTLEYWERLAAIDLQQSELRYRIASLYAKHTKDYAKAGYWYNETLKLDPNNAMSLNNLGAVYFNMQQYQKSAEAFEKYLRLAPTDKMVYKHLSTIYQLLGQPQKADEYLKKFNQ